MQKQIISGPYTVNVRNWRTFCARIGRYHHVAFLFRLHELLRDVTPHNFVRKVLTLRLATLSINLKALLQSQTTSLEANVH